MPRNSITSPDTADAARLRLERDVERAGFYPALVLDVVDDGLDGEPVIAHMVHQETHIDRRDVHRHVTVLVLGERTLQIVHIDDEDQDETGSRPIAQLTGESVHVADITAVIVGYAHGMPTHFARGDRMHEISVTIGWSGGLRVDVQPAGCPDPECDMDHGSMGTLNAEDIMLRVNEAADGREAVERARTFVRALRRARLAERSRAR
ncbi:DUF5998 family protein [Falsarthrobacter nasiphocae]|uniref:Cell wall biosynthesis glycosyltransferase n=1 Tax=Falsarthrobacter nasiphocae TaxID=189863 RepID=A0AAE3YDN7_9MICC|nr:DUF5998 family protein [Falsarthrobacter nasiphocae]MDR6891270.1 hypothetical protein [Falsarthrobacter nasiphocae]